MLAVNPNLMQRGLPVLVYPEVFLLQPPLKNIGVEITFKRTRIVGKSQGLFKLLMIMPHTPNILCIS